MVEREVAKKTIFRADFRQGQCPGKSFGDDIFLRKYNALWIVRGSGCIHNRGQRLLIDGFWINDFGFATGQQKVMPLIMVI